MLDVLNKKSQVTPTSDTKSLAHYRKQLQLLVKKATEDGEITKTEYDQLRELTEKADISDSELNEMIRVEFKKDLIAKVQLFVEDDGKVDKNEMKVLVHRANEIGISDDQLNSYINEALAKYDIERKKRFREKIHKIGISVAVAAAASAVAFVGVQVQKNKILVNASKQGNYKINLSTITHASRKNQDD